MEKKNEITKFKFTVVKKKICAGSDQWVLLMTSRTASTIYEVPPFQLIKSLWPLHSSGTDVCVPAAVSNLRDVLHIPVSATQLCKL